MIYMFKGIVVGIVFVGLLMVCGFVLIWYIWWFVIVLFVVMIVLVIIYIFNYKCDYYILVEDVVWIEVLCI